MSEKVTGYILLIVGILVMIFAVIQVFLVFTNKIKPMDVFHLSSSDINSVVDQSKLIPQTGSDNQVITQPKINLIPPQVLNDALNFSTHFFLMSFLLGFGYRISSLGVMFLRPVIVKLKTKEESAVTIS